MEQYGNILADIVKISFEILAPVITILVTYYARKWFKLRISERQQEQVERIIAQAVDYAEQELRKKQAEKGSEGDNRLDWAWKFAYNTIQDQGLPEKATLELTALIEAHIGARNEYKPLAHAILPTGVPKKKRAAKKTAKRKAARRKQ